MHNHFISPTIKTPQSAHKFELLQNDSIDTIEEEQQEEEDSDKVQESWMSVDKEKLLEKDIEKFHACLSPDSINEDHISEDLHDMISGSQGIQDYIESWFRAIIGSQCSILQYLLTSSQSRKLVSHILVHIKEYLSNLHMSLSIILL